MIYSNPALGVLGPAQSHMHTAKCSGMGGEIRDLKGLLT